jgi:phytoene synthase
MIRARDALARGHAALTRLTWRAKWRLKFWWIGALELLNEVERRDFDVWGAPVTLNRWRTAQVYLQTYIGRATARMS